MQTITTENEMANRNEELLFDPDYWSDRAEELRNQADSIARSQPCFRAILERHAEDMDRLATKALKLRQERNRVSRVLPRFRDPNNLIPIRGARTGTE